ncbi:TPA: kinase inhibitor, partial [Enterobacter kobei]|nr:kinase inhibitor [Enterobacter kobei]
MKKRNVIVTTALAAISFQVLAATPFSITSQDISREHRLAQQQVFNGFGCHGDNQS